NPNIGISVTGDHPALAASNIDSGATASTSISDLWHLRLGHLSKSGLQSIIKSDCVKGINIPHSSTIHDLSSCTVCSIAKAKRKSINDHKITFVTDIMNRLDADLCGPIKNNTGDIGYILTLVAIHSRMLFLHII